MNIETLMGRKLDMAVAQYVLGYVVEERVDPATGEKDAVSREPGMGRKWVRVAFYGSKLGATLNVEFELRRRGWKRRGVLANKYPSGVAEVILEHSDGRMVKATGGSFNEALCRAALKTVAEE